MPVDGHTLHPNPSKPSCSSLGHLARTSGPDRPLQGQSKQREGKGNCWLWYQPLNTESASVKQLWSEAEETVVNISLAPHQSTQAADLGQHNLPALGGLTISQHLKSKYILQIIPGWSNPVYFHRARGFLFLAVYLTGNLCPQRPLSAALSLQATELPPNTPCYSISHLSPCLYFKDQRTWLRAVLFRLIFSQKTAGFSDFCRFKTTLPKLSSPESKVSQVSNLAELGLRVQTSASFIFCFLYLRVGRWFKTVISVPKQ